MRTFSRGSWPDRDGALLPFAIMFERCYSDTVDAGREARRRFMLQGLVEALGSDRTRSSARRRCYAPPDCV